MKKRTLGLIIAGVAAASMVGTGFAAWVITANATAEETGQFAVDVVENKGIEIDAEFGSNEGTINFFGPTSANTGWLTVTGDTREKLDTDLTIGFTYTDSTAEDFNIKFTFEGSDEYAAALAANYIVAPVLTVGETTITSGTAVALNSIDSTGSITLNIEFGWGAVFGSKNPYEFYNTFKYGDKVNQEANAAPVKDDNGTTDIQTVAETDLTGLHALNNATFKIIIEVTPKSAA
ncbi:MAG: hypothetical protein IKN46_05420 [Acholeplasmatales bacterium]|nr:hypothetical protein [Acholeplasmatales bacterium]